PFAGGVNVFAGAQIHHGIGPPFCCPTHLLDFFLDRGCDGGVADVGVDLYQEIPADDHWLGFRVIDVGRDDGAPARDLVTDELRSDRIADFRFPIFDWLGTGVAMAEIVWRIGVPPVWQASILPA